MRAKVVLGAALAGLFISSALPPAAAGTSECERHMTAAAARYGIPLGMLYAVGLTETGRGDSLRPYALNIEGQAVYELTKDQAVAQFERARRSGARSIDVGCMQINAAFHGKNFASVEDMLDPARNVDYAARFLKELKAREGSWTMAVARYHAGPDNDPAQKRYVCRVITNMIAAGFGAWTKEAEGFCSQK